MTPKKLYNRLQKEVYQYDELLNQGGIVEYQMKDIVKMTDGHYLLSQNVNFSSRVKSAIFFADLFGVLKTLIFVIAYISVLLYDYIIK